MPSYAIVLSFQGWKVPRTQPLEASNSSSLPPFRLDGWQIRAVAYPICGVLPCRRCRHTSSWEASSWLCASACPSRATPVSRRTAVGGLNLHISSQFITSPPWISLGLWASEDRAIKSALKCAVEGKSESVRPFVLSKSLSLLRRHEERMQYFETWSLILVPSALATRNEAFRVQERLLDTLWLLFTSWAATCLWHVVASDTRLTDPCWICVSGHLQGWIWLTACHFTVFKAGGSLVADHALDDRFTFVALWLALRFQMKISGSARERLLRPGLGLLLHLLRCGCQASH